MTLETLGERLKSLRTYLGLTQTQLANKLNVGQQAVSRIETGKGGEIKFLLALLNLYSDHITIDSLLSDNFNIIENEPRLYKKDLNQICIEKLKLLKEDLTTEIDSAIKVLES